MFHRILVPLDGSTQAEQPLSLATDFARQTGASLILLRVINLATDYWPAVAGPYGLTMECIDEEQDFAEEYLRGVAARSSFAGISTTCITRFGSVIPIILAVAKEEQADLIMMSSHGHTGLAHLILGSSADSVARHASIPTLIFHQDGAFAHDTVAADRVGHLAQPLNLLVPLDGSVYAEFALQGASALLAMYAAMGRKVALHLVRVVKWPVSGLSEGASETEMDQFYQEELREAREYLGALVEKLRSGELVPELARIQPVIIWSITTGKDVAETIVRVATGGEDATGSEIFGGCQTLAISTHGRGAIQRLMMGSVAERIVHLCKQPVLVVHPSSALSLARPVLTH